MSDVQTPSDLLEQLRQRSIGGGWLSEFLKAIDTINAYFNKKPIKVTDLEAAFIKAKIALKGTKRDTTEDFAMLRSLAELCKIDLNKL